MNNFESTLVKSFNAFFEKNNIKGFAHRLKQSRFTGQLVDVLVDSLNPDYYLAVECKSIDASRFNAIYFTQHFSVDRKGVHQILRITDFLQRSGRKGFLAVELRYGSGRAKKAYMIPWEHVVTRFNEGVGFTVDEIRGFPWIARRAGLYEIDPASWLKR
jgi:hypothetical protein